MEVLVKTCIERPLLQILVVVANTQVRALRSEVGKVSM